MYAAHKSVKNCYTLIVEIIYIHECIRITNL